MGPVLEELEEGTGECAGSQAVVLDRYSAPFAFFGLSSSSESIIITSLAGATLQGSVRTLPFFAIDAAEKKSSSEPFCGASLRFFVEGRAMYRYHSTWCSGGRAVRVDLVNSCNFQVCLTYSSCLRTISITSIPTSLAEMSTF